MDELYIKNENSKIPVDPKIIKKYHIKKGALSPFTNSRIVDSRGSDSPDDSANKAVERDLEQKPEDGVSDLEGGVMLTTSEILDFAQGADSD
ncbi:hypothetical protein SDC9_141479 [bioreactor metagenome]|uniref:Uncharacterized protein n=1 Tax=bioreactor metagenome TaxID=1076179 RepID=A0A645E0F0_9ZZZZ